jgi:hypothetical protein
MDPIELLERHMGAFNRRDLEEFLSYYHEDNIGEDGDGKIILQGRTAQRAFLTVVFKQSPDLHCEILNKMRVEPFVVLEEYTTDWHAEGFPTEVHDVVIYRIENDKITRSRFLT